MEGDRWAPYNTRSKREKTVYSTAPEYGEDDFAPGEGASKALLMMKDMQS